MSLRARGLVRAFGVAGSWRGLQQLDDWLSPLGEVIQTQDRDLPSDVAPDITYGALSAQRQAYGQHVALSDASARLQAALRRRPRGVVIFSTTRVAHLLELAAATDEVV